MAKVSSQTVAVPTGVWGRSRRVLAAHLLPPSNRAASDIGPQAFHPCLQPGGQEAPLVIYSLATSSHTDAPRGMEFLYSANRLNVATSRAKCLCVLVAAPAVFEAECRTPKQMQLANAFCRYLELAATI